MFGLYSSLITLALSSVAWPSGVGITLGLLVGLGLAYALVDRVLEAQRTAVHSTIVRRLASLCCLLWSLVLPLALAAAGLVWGVGSGVGSLVEGPVSTTVRATTHTWLTAANEIGVGALKRLPLAKRLTERELLTVVQAAPDVISTMLDQERVGAVWQKATGAPMPPQLASVLRHEFHALTSQHGEWLHPVVERLRSRTQGGGPTVQEAIEAMVSPAVFNDAADAIRSTTRRDARNIALAALALSALLGAGLWLAWTRLAPAALRRSPGGETHDK